MLAEKNHREAAKQRGCWTTGKPKGIGRREAEGLDDKLH